MVLLQTFRGNGNSEEKPLLKRKSSLKALAHAAELAQAGTFEHDGRMADAEAVYRQILGADPSCHLAWHALGVLTYTAGNASLAIQCIEAAIACDNSIALYHRNIGEMYRRAGQLEKSAKAGRSAVKLAPDDIDAHYNLGLAYTDSKDYVKAVQSYTRAVRLDSDHGLSWNNLGSALEQQGDKMAAKNAYARAVAINHGHAEAQNNLGAIQLEQGELDAARSSFETAIAAKPDFVEAHYNLSALKSYTPDDPHLATLESIYAQRESLSEHARIRYDFALGKALDDIGDYDRSFAAYDEGNRLHHALVPLDEARADAVLNSILEVFNTDFFASRTAWSGVAEQSRHPIFIVGMPRSGTTLLEQILCSHASVYGAGELPDLHDVVTETCGAPAIGSFADRVMHLNEAKIRQLGEEYLTRVWRLSPESRYITDKMPANFFYLGLIHLALPGAKIIHAMRDPMDSCFSCFTKLFSDTMEFAYDQGTLGRYYVRYMTLMDHWRHVLPQGTVLDMRYEDMVADTETQARRVIEFVGLPWDANCLKFHENRRLVKTASVAQVRKPIYKTAVARWKHYAPYLRPLLEIVRNFRTMDADDEVLLATAPLTRTRTTDSLAAEPRSAPDWHAQGVTHYQAERHAEAVAAYERALEMRPDFPEALNSKGFVLQDMGQVEEARVCFARAVELAPAFAMGRLNLAMAQLKLGDWKNGWDNYEARWDGSIEAKRGTFQRPVVPLPQWDGSSTTGQGKRILIVTEQGFGDTFQFSRYLPLVAQRFAKVGFVCSAPTLRLMEWAFAESVVILDKIPMDYAGWDMYCPMMSLPRAFGTRLETIPKTVPYFRVPVAAARHWGDRLEIAAPNRLRIGLAWAGRGTHQHDSRRSLRFEEILPLLQGKDVAWVSLQKWTTQDARPEIPANVAWLDWTEELRDFADTAALIENLDLTITIDSAMVHLAGALHRPVWMLNRFAGEWRWLQGREDSPWYPSLRIFNQTCMGDWTRVLADVDSALGQLAVSRRVTNTLMPAQRLPIPVSRPLDSVREQAYWDSVTAMILPSAPRSSPEQAMQSAWQHLSNGRLLEAESLLDQLLESQPRHAHALHLLGVVRYQRGMVGPAMALIEQAINADGTIALFHSNLAEMYRQQTETAAAIRHGEMAVSLDPGMASAHANLGIAYYDAKEYARAELCHQKALSLEPRLIQSLNNLGSIARAHKDRGAAAGWYRKALELSADYVEALSNLGAVLLEDDRIEDSVAPLQRALQLHPDHPEALCNLGLARFRQDRSDEAQSLLLRSLQVRADYPEALSGLARVLHEHGQLDEAERLLRRAVERNPDSGDAWCQLGGVCAEQGDPITAEAAYGQALAIDPEMADALAGMGNLRLEQGEIDEAEKLTQQAIAFEPDNLGARFHLTQIRKVAPGDANLVALEARLTDEGDLNANQRISLHYALGKAYDDLQEWDLAFVHFLKGARLKRAKLNYSADADAACIDRIIQVVDAAFIERLRGSGNPSDVPVFVLGMPRSGTTLTEQIIASHPAVYGAGELRDLMDLVQGQSMPGVALPFPDNIAALSSTTITAWGTEYVARLRRLAPRAQRITDKMPANYLALGLIPLLLPNAKIIHVRRNPVDTCVSCFTRLFNRHQDATYDLAELGRHYANYGRLMQHWRQVLPAASFMEVVYEDIVADMESSARRLIDYCGLEWNDACLSFYKTERNVRTASVTQVRQPIYTSSVERWRHYEKHLGPLLAALAE